MTEFEKWWLSMADENCDKVFAKDVWDAAQRALLRTMHEPPCVPFAGQRIRFLGLCHPATMRQIREVDRVYRQTLDVMWIETRDPATGNVSGGVLSEVELVT